MEEPRLLWECHLRSRFSFSAPWTAAPRPPLAKLEKHPPTEKGFPANPGISGGPQDSSRLGSAAGAGSPTGCVHSRAEAHSLCLWGARAALKRRRVPRLVLSSETPAWPSLKFGVLDECWFLCAESTCQTRAVQRGTERRKCNRLSQRLKGFLVDTERRVCFVQGPGCTWDLFPPRCKQPGKLPQFTEPRALWAKWALEKHRLEEQRQGTDSLFACLGDTRTPSAGTSRARGWVGWRAALLRSA